MHGFEDLQSALRKTGNLPMQWPVAETEVQQVVSAQNCKLSDEDWTAFFVGLHIWGTDFSHDAFQAFMGQNGQVRRLKVRHLSSCYEVLQDKVVHNLGTQTTDGACPWKTSCFPRHD